MKKLDNKTVQGDGFCIFVPDIHTVVYSEEGRTARIEIEGGMSGNTVDWSVYPETMSGWHVEGGHKAMDVSDKDTILRRISKGLDILEMPHQIV